MSRGAPIGRARTDQTATASPILKSQRAACGLPPRATRAGGNLGPGSGFDQGVAGGGGPSMIPAGSVVVLQGSARRVLTTLVNDLHVAEVTFALDNGEHVYQLLPDLANDDWHVLQDGDIVRSFNIPPKGE